MTRVGFVDVEFVEMLVDLLVELFVELFVESVAVVAVGLLIVEGADFVVAMTARVASADLTPQAEMCAKTGPVGYCAFGGSVVVGQMVEHAGLVDPFAASD